MIDEALLQTIRALADRQAIEDCLLRYARGVDRFDRELMRSAYHDDAIDDHGLVVLPPDPFVDWAIGYHQEHNPVHHHVVTNSSIELDGDTAHAESYYLFIGTAVQGPSVLAIGRYVDRLEKREGRWGIVRRNCFNEAVHEIAEATLPEAHLRLMTSNGPQARDHSDASYMRPLEIAAARLRG
jgi:ketosteroid isomerase-like protein